MLLQYRDEAQQSLMQRHYRAESRIARCTCGDRASSCYLKLFEPCRLVEQAGARYDLWVACDACRVSGGMLQ